jgi:DNA-binding MarR family transcriptional regulator
MSAGESEETIAREAWSCFFGLMTSEANRRRMAMVCDHFGITPGQMRSFVTMGPGPARPMKDLAVVWHCDASYVTVMVDDLEERGWVERRANPDDRRSRVVALTPAGVDTRRHLLDQLGEPPPFLAALSADEQRTMRDLLRKLLAAASGAAPGPAEGTS